MIMRDFCAFFFGPNRFFNHFLTEKRGATPSGFPPPSAAPPSPKRTSRHLRRLESLGGMPRSQRHEPQRGKPRASRIAQPAPSAWLVKTGGAIAPFVRKISGFKDSKTGLPETGGCPKRSEGVTKRGKLGRGDYLSLGEALCTNRIQGA